MTPISAKQIFGPLLQDDEFFFFLGGGPFPKRLWGRKKFVNACLGLPTHRHNYCKMSEFDNKKIQNHLPPTVQCKGSKEKTRDQNFPLITLF
jgi:hypothetical protein